MMQYTTTEGSQGICPADWHLPEDAELTSLTTYVNSQPAYRCNNNNNFISKSMAATTNWSVHTAGCAPGNNLFANNATGFAWLPSGNRSVNGLFNQIDNRSYMWSSTQNNVSTSWLRLISNGVASIDRNNDYKDYGYSVRCLKD
jgi:uncharacterized protein (TIGR02145 family)